MERWFGSRFNSVIFTANPGRGSIWALAILIAGDPRYFLVYRLRCGHRECLFDPDSIRRAIGDIPINHIEVLNLCKGTLREN